MITFLRATALLLALSFPVSGAPITVAPGARGDDGLAREIDALVREAMQAPAAVGLSVAVAVGDEMVLAEGYGLAEVEHDVPADADTLFRIGSVTKQFTAAAIVRLAEQGKLYIDDDVRSFLPDYPTHGHEVTLRHLLTHTSGIRGYTELGPAFWSDAAVELTHDEMVARWKDLPFQFPPGTRWAYSNSGYYLLGMVVEEVSGRTYAEYLAQELFEPLELTHIRYDSNVDIVKNRAQGYRLVDGVLANDGLIATSRPGAAGALIASAKDLVRWQIALVSGEVVRPESYEEMTTPFLLDDNTETKYGFGLMLAELEGRPCVRHGGGIFGFNAELLYLPEERVSVAAISNCEGFRAENVAFAVAREVLRDVSETTGR